MRNFTFILAVIFFNSCASYQNGNVAQTIDTQNNLKESNLKLKVTGFADRELSTKYFTYLQVEFGNNSDKWIEVEKVFMLYKGTKLKVVLGSRLTDWANAIQNKIDVDRNNKLTVMGAITAFAAVGAVTNINDGNMAASSSYATVMSGTAIAMEVNELSNKITDIERAKIFPENHLYSSFSVPPGLVSKRWLLLQHPEGLTVGTFVFEVFYKDNTKERYSVNINNFNSLN